MRNSSDQLVCAILRERKWITAIQNGMFLSRPTTRQMHFFAQTCNSFNLFALSICFHKLAARKVYGLDQVATDAIVFSVKYNYMHACLR